MSPLPPLVLLRLLDPAADLERARRVIRLSLAVARRQHPGLDLMLLEQAATLQAVGQVGLHHLHGAPRAQRQFLRAHGMIGARLIAPWPVPAAVVAAVAAQHERWDGRGHPHGLAGRAIPVMARLIRLAATAEALARTDGPQEAHRLLNRLAGRALDPDLVGALLGTDLPPRVDEGCVCGSLG